MAAKLTRLTHKIAIQLHLVTEMCNICSSRSRKPVRKLLDTPSDVDYIILFHRKDLEIILLMQILNTPENMSVKCIMEQCL